MKITTDLDDTWPALWREVKVWFATWLMGRALAVLPDDAGMRPVRTHLLAAVGRLGTEE